jgi:hypothetical protein
MMCRIWNAMKKYIHDVVVNHKFLSNEKNSSCAHPLLQKLSDELKNPGLAELRGVPKFDTTETLIEFLTTILWTCTG